MQCQSDVTLSRSDQTQQQAACSQLAAIEQRFHQLFQTAGKPVKHDHNSMLRANIYQSKQQYVELASQHFLMPTDNGGMYLEGTPSDPDNQARFIAYQATWLQPEFVVWNLEHEYVHYLDGRFNQYGSFGHYPLNRTTWWSEGLAEFIAHGQCFAGNIAGGIARHENDCLGCFFHLAIAAKSKTDP